MYSLPKSGNDIDDMPGVFEQEVDVFGWEPNFPCAALDQSHHTASHSCSR